MRYEWGGKKGGNFGPVVRFLRLYAGIYNGSYVYLLYNQASYLSATTTLESSFVLLFQAVIDPYVYNWRMIVTLLITIVIVVYP